MQPGADRRDDFDGASIPEGVYGISRQVGQDDISAKRAYHSGRCQRTVTPPNRRRRLRAKVDK
jgi:hypothetical protein